MPAGPRFTKESRPILNVLDVKIIRTPPRSPNLNAFAERFLRSIKEECLGRLISFSEKQLLTAVSENVEHYHREGNHREGNHRGLESRLAERRCGQFTGTGKLVRDSRLGGLLDNYRWAA